MPIVAVYNTLSCERMVLIIMLRFSKNIFLFVVGFISLFLCITLIITTFVIVGELRDNGWLLGTDCYVSDDFEVLYIDDKEYHKFEVPFDLSAANEIRGYYLTQFSDLKEEKGSIYIESVSKRYPLVWVNDVEYLLREYSLSESIKVMQISNEDTDEVYNYCLTEQIFAVETIVNNVTWSQNLTFAVPLDEYEDAMIGAPVIKMSPEFSKYILDSREKFSSVAMSYGNVKINIGNSATDIAIYQYDDSMNFRRRLFVIRQMTDGSFLLYDEHFMVLYTQSPNATLEDYSYLSVPNNLEQEINSLMND